VFLKSPVRFHAGVVGGTTTFAADRNSGTRHQGPDFGVRGLATDLILGLRKLRLNLSDCGLQGNTIHCFNLASVDQPLSRSGTQITLENLHGVVHLCPHFCSVCSYYTTNGFSGQPVILLPKACNFARFVRRAIQAGSSKTAAG